MPTSSTEGKDIAVAWLQDLPVPRTVVDVGAGEGTWVRLLRDDWPDAHWTGVEIHAPYVDRFGLTDLYDRVIVADVRDLDWQAHWPAGVDVMIFGDVLEHMPRSDATVVFERATQAAKTVLVALPIVEYPQGSVDGNDHEAHVDTWTHSEAMATFRPSRFWCGEQIGVYLT